MTSLYLLDTNTFSYIAKGTSVSARGGLENVLRDRDLDVCLSVITEAEVRYGMEKRALSRARRSAIEGLFANVRILPWGSDEAAVYGRVRANLEAQGITVALHDLQIAAQAIASGAVLVTHDHIFAMIDDLPMTVDWAIDL